RPPRIRSATLARLRSGTAAAPARFLAGRAQSVQLLLEPDLQAPLDRTVIDAFAHGVGEPGLVQGHAALGVMVVLVALVVTQLLHQLRRRIAQVHGYLGRTVFVDVCLGGVVRGIRRVGLG